VKTIGASVSSYAERCFVKGQLGFLFSRGGAILWRHTISPKLSQVAAIFQWLVEHQESEILSALVLQEPVRLPFEHRIHHERLLAGLMRE
jgi:hypothetical protein